MNKKDQRVNLKGKATRYGDSPHVSYQTIEDQFFKVDKGPRMLPRKVRFKAWGGLFMVSGWVAFCFSMLAYRLRGDDLDIMERQVYDELAEKKKLTLFQAD